MLTSPLGAVYNQPPSFTIKVGRLQAITGTVFVIPKPNAFSPAAASQKITRFPLQLRAVSGVFRLSNSQLFMHRLPGHGYDVIHTLNGNGQHPLLGDFDKALFLEIPDMEVKDLI